VNRFDGRTAIVTGAASGIGLALAQLLRAEGATVVGADLVEADVECDVSREEDVERLVRHALATTGRLDVVCNNAGIGSTSDPVSCTLEEWERVFAVNVRGVFLGTKHALPHLLDRGSGAIVNTASVAGLVGLRDRAAYGASKGAVISFTKQVAVQYAGTGVRCNCVCPGTVDSPWVGRLLAEADDPEAARRALVARQPVGRLGRPEEVASVIAYLASDDAAFVTGAAWVIDGGLAAG
jgi:NAD(P)-dependent dehydrogenase (short-subunit alcohol dehydrogenase family)